jgi:hypothetical protein
MWARDRDRQGAAGHCVELNLCPALPKRARARFLSGEFVASNDRTGQIDGRHSATHGELLTHLAMSRRVLRLVAPSALEELRSD